MADSDKNILITPNRGQANEPKIEFVGSSSLPITLKVLDDNSLSWEGGEGQLFSITNNLSTGTIFSVNDISGVPSIEVDADGTVVLAEFSGNVGVGTASPSHKLTVSGTLSASVGLFGSITGSLAGTATQVSQTLTRGSYLTGNNYNGSAATTWAVDATSANTASKVVARDGSGNFSAGTITATAVRSGNGTVADPAFAPSSDTNTGIFFPATHTIAFTEGGVERMRIDSNGDVGIGNTSPEERLHVNGTILSTVSSTGNNDNIEIRKTTPVSTSNVAYRFSHRSDGNELWLYSYDGSTFRNYVEFNHSSNYVGFPAGNAGDSDTLFIDLANSRVGIGTISPSSLLDVAGDLRVDTDTLFVDSTNNRVGIGTASPAHS